MLYLNCNRIFQLRGIDKPLNFLVNNGFFTDVAFRILHNEASHIKMQYLGRICELLQCTPNELFAYQPDKNSIINPDHPLLSLNRDVPSVNFADHLQNASFDELKEIQTLILQQKEKKGKETKQ